MPDINQSESTDSNPNILEQIEEYLGRGVLAHKLKRTPGAISHLRRSGKVPVKLCARIEIITRGKFVRADIRPDHFGELDYDSDPMLITD